VGDAEGEEEEGEGGLEEGDEGLTVVTGKLMVEVVVAFSECYEGC
jgi:hypothetical protein